MSLAQPIHCPKLDTPGVAARTACIAIDGASDSETRNELGLSGYVAATAARFADVDGRRTVRGVPGDW